MKTTIYLPNHIHKLAKNAKLNMSKLLREAIEAEVHQDNPHYFKLLQKMEQDKLEKQKVIVEKLQLKKKKANKKKKKQNKKLAPNKEDIIIYGE